MAYEPKPNTGTLFKNDKREKDTHPNATGTALIGGVKYKVAAWTKEGAKGKFQSLSFTPQDQPRDDGGEEPQRRGSMKDHFGDEVPFIYEWR